jgi:hypothetical protein
MDKKEYTEEMVRLIIEGAIQEEREACARYLEGYATRFNDIRSAALEVAAEHLRARGQSEVS